MKLMVEYPVQSRADGGAWLRPENIADFARALEAAGYHAVSLTDHPAPSRKWLNAGGHETFDPYAGLAYWAATTSTIRLMTHLAVVPYRNPFLHARSMMTADVLSGGRTTFALGTGYLRSEFAALGVDFEQRNALFDQSVEVLLQALSGEPVTYEGVGLSAREQQLLPVPVQRPHPPLWFGGNSRAALERVARWGQGWAALMGSPQLATSARTASLSTHDDLAARLQLLGEHLEGHGRTLADVDVMVPTPAADLDTAMSDAERVDTLGRLAGLGVTWVRVVVPPQRYAEAVAAAQWFSAELVPQLA